jgi:hypothetical protein
LLGAAGDSLITHLMVAHDLTLREAELHAEVLVSQQQGRSRLARV